MPVLLMISTWRSAACAAPVSIVAAAKAVSRRTMRFLPSSVGDQSGRDPDWLTGKELTEDERPFFTPRAPTLSRWEGSLCGGAARLGIKGAVFGCDARSWCEQVGAVRLTHEGRHVP